MYIHTNSNQIVCANSGYYNFGKSIFEVIVLMVIIIPLLPFSLFTVVYLFIFNKGKVVYKQKRIGFHGKEFTIYKFRTLHKAIDLNLEKDPSIIKDNSHSFGLLLRKTGLDEILQIINFIKGDMNLIGPRPLLMRDLQHLSLGQFKSRHCVNPGILDIWQLRRKYDDDKTYYRYDMYYIKNMSLLMDVYILLSTINYLLRARVR